MDTLKREVSFLMDIHQHISHHLTIIVPFFQVEKVLFAWWSMFFHQCIIKGNFFLNYWMLVHHDSLIVISINIGPKVYDVVKLQDAR